MDEQRKFVRHPLEGKVVLKLKDGSVRSFTTDLVDISLVGMGVYAKEKLESGITANFVMMTKLHEKPVTGIGKVKYCLEVKKQDSSIYRVGLVFVSIAETDVIPRIIERIQLDSPQK